MPGYAWPQLEDRLIQLSRVWNTSPLQPVQKAPGRSGSPVPNILAQYRRLVVDRPDFHDGSTVQLIPPRSARVGAGSAFYVDQETESKWLIVAREHEDPAVFVRTAVSRGPPQPCNCVLSEALLLLALYRLADVKPNEATTAVSYGGGTATFRVNPIRAKALSAGLAHVGALRTTSLGAGNEWCDLFDGEDCVLAVRGAPDHPEYHGAAASQKGWQRLTDIVGAWGGVYRRHGAKGRWKLIDD